MHKCRQIFETLMHHTSYIIYYSDDKKLHHLLQFTSSCRIEMSAISSSLSISFLIRKSLPLYTSPFIAVSLRKVNGKTPKFVSLSSHAMMGNDPFAKPGKTPPEFPSAPPPEEPSVPPEVPPRAPDVPEFDPIPPENPADPPPDFPGPPFPSPPGDDPPPLGPDVPGKPEIIPPHGPDVIPPKPPEPPEPPRPLQPDIPPPIMFGSIVVNY
nr:vegetative cell wall protein gp1-like [Ipomoea trifida]